MASKNQLNIGKICISSVYEKEQRFKDFRYAAYRAGKDLGYYVLRNPEDAGSTQESFEKFLENERPIFVLLVGEMKSEIVKKECQKALSLGLPIITMLKTNGTNISKNTTKFMTSISKATYEKSCSCFTNAEDLYKTLQKRLVEYENERNLATAKFIPQRVQLYAKSSEIIQHAKKRIVLCQQTSSIILGPRKGVSVERDFYNGLFDWILKADNDMEFVHIFSSTETKQEINKKGSEYDSKNAKKQIVGLCNNKTLEIHPIIRATAQEVMSCIICDNDLLVPLQIGNQNYNLFLSHYITDGATISKIVADIQSIRGELLYSDEIESTVDLENFYKKS